MCAEKRGEAFMSNDVEKIRRAIENGETSIGIELGSTRIKTVMIDKEFNPIASGSHGWENSLVDGIWTYSLRIWNGINSYRDMGPAGSLPVGTVTDYRSSALCHDARLHALCSEGIFHTFAFGETR